MTKPTKKSNYDPPELTEDDFVAALGDIADVAPELIEYILTCYPIEFMIHLPDELCQHIEASKESLSSLDPEDFSSFLNSS